MCNVAVNIVSGLNLNKHKALVLISSHVDKYEPASYLRINPISKFGFFKHLYTLAFTYFNRKSIFHCHGMASVFPFILRIPYIIHIHGSDLREIKTRNFFASWLYLKALSNAKVVVVVSQDLIQNYYELGLDISKLHFIPNSVKSSPIDFADKQINYSRVELFCPSSNHPIKFKDKLIDAFILLNSKYQDRLRLTLIDHPETKALLKRHALDEHVMRNIFLIPLMSHKDLLSKYKEFDIVLDQFGEIMAHGVVAYEACSKGIPVISTLGETVFKGSGIYPGHSSNLIFKSVSELIDNRLINRAGLKSYRWVSENLNNSVISDRVYSLYNSYFRKSKLDSR